MTAPRLTIEEPEAGFAASVRFDRWDPADPARAQFEWRIWDLTSRTGSPGFDCSGADLRLGSGADPNEAEALAGLLDFLGAFAEAVQHERRTGSRSEGSSLFPDGLRPLAEGLDSGALSLTAEALRGREEEPEARTRDRAENIAESLRRAEELLGPYVRGETCGAALGPAAGGEVLGLLARARASAEDLLPARR
jgi:hypothetical protein